MKYLKFFEENNKEFSNELDKNFLAFDIGKYVIVDFETDNPYLLCKVTGVGLGDDHRLRVKFDYYNDHDLKLIPSSLQLKNFKVVEVFDNLKKAKERYFIMMNIKKYNL